MKNISKLALLSTLLLCGVVLSGCMKRKLEQRTLTSTGTLEMRINWGEGFSPQGAKLLIYDQGNQLHKELPIARTNEPFTCELDPGVYKLIIHNTDYENVNFKDLSDHSAAMVLAGMDEVPTEGTEIQSPSNIHGIGMADGDQLITIEAAKTTQTSASPVSLTRKVKFVFKITGLDDVTKFTGRLVGVSPGVLLSTGGSLPISCFQKFTGVTTLNNVSGAQDAPSEIQLFSELEFFDLVTPQNNEVEGINTIDVSITSGQGKSYALTEDVTPVINEIIIANGGTLPIEIPIELDVKIDPVTSNITVTVTQWDDTGTGNGNPQLH